MLKFLYHAQFHQNGVMSQTVRPVVIRTSSDRDFITTWKTFNLKVRGLKYKSGCF